MGIHQSRVGSLQKRPWCGALIFSLIRACTHVWVNNLDAGDLIRNSAHYDVSVAMWGGATVSAVGGAAGVRRSCMNRNMNSVWGGTAWCAVKEDWHEEQQEEWHEEQWQEEWHEEQREELNKPPANQHCISITQKEIWKFPQQEAAILPRPQCVNTY